ncbi:MAG: hypothetical protein B9S37_04385 [Verrucomicrobiia bacterium Tous-C3TDCM]|nr:MAG: hypothetical protein B9S37_04385 [Verrucomicrobiae bacterium Tous-C3TDCM]PAZ06888.1 MAG: hypothetical protein CAK88_03035 [Verrucomicrobiae bacterium AMD-G2]
MQTTIRKIGSGIFAALVMMQSSNAGTISVYSGKTTTASMTFTATTKNKATTSVMSFYVLDYDAAMQPLTIAKYDVDTKAKTYKKDNSFALTAVTKRGLYAIGNVAISQSSVNHPLLASLDKTGLIIQRLDLITTSTQSSSTTSTIIKSATASASLQRGIYLPASPASATFAAAEIALKAYFTKRGYTLAAN